MSFDNPPNPDSSSLEFNHVFSKACRAANMEPCPGPLLEDWLNEAGFEDNRAERFVWPMGTWPANKYLVRIPRKCIIRTHDRPHEQKEVIAMNYLQITESLKAFTCALVACQLGYLQKEVDVVCSKIRTEMKDPNTHAIIHLSAEQQQFTDKIPTGML